MSNISKHHPGGALRVMKRKTISENSSPLNKSSKRPCLGASNRMNIERYFSPINKPRAADSQNAISDSKDCSKRAPLSARNALDCTNIIPVNKSRNSSKKDILRFPLPKFSWSDSEFLWSFMLETEKMQKRDGNMFINDRHPSVTPIIRSMLLDWISEVCQAYNLSRQTYYAAIDYFDRYLSLTYNVSKKRIQLIGITCLFIAAKIEEIFPPKIGRFAFVCDGACTEAEIVMQELELLSVLQWEINPVTPIIWLGLYLQNHSNAGKENSEYANDGERYLIPNFHTTLFVQIAHLMDLCILSEQTLQFDYSVIAAAALYHFTSQQVVEQFTGKTVSEIHNCIEWMIPFAYAIKEEGTDFIDKMDLSTYQQVDFQIHTVSVELLKKAEEFSSTIPEKDEPAASSDNLKADHKSEHYKSSESGIGISVVDGSSVVSPRRSSFRQNTLDHSRHS